MITHSHLIACLETYAPLAYQEPYDNAGLLVGNSAEACTGCLLTLDVTLQTIQEAIAQGCNLVVSHHPIIFKPLRSIKGDTEESQAIILAIKNNIALYAIHTNLDNQLRGVNQTLVQKLQLVNTHILLPQKNSLQKLQFYCPAAFEAAICEALFEAGAGQIGHYEHCKFSHTGSGQFRPTQAANPFIGSIGNLHTQAETKVEMVFPTHLQKQMVATLKKTHPYEEPAYDLLPLNNTNSTLGSGVVGELKEPTDAKTLFLLLKKALGIPVIKHSAVCLPTIQKVALCGGSGSFLIGAAQQAQADIFITADLKYHDYFLANAKLILADIGHWESEQFTIDLLYEVLRLKFPTFALLKTTILTNPVHYFI